MEVKLNEVPWEHKNTDCPACAHVRSLVHEGWAWLECTDCSAASARAREVRAAEAADVGLAKKND